MMAVTDLDSGIDGLFQFPLDQFTAARNALAKMFKGADRLRIQTLKKPAVAPWAVNQLYWHERPLYDRLMTTGRALRRDQIGALEGRPAQVTWAAGDHRQALIDASAAAGRLAQASAVPLRAEPLLRLLETLSLARQPPARPGCLESFVQPGGFEDLSGVSPTPAAAHSVERPTTREPPPPRVSRTPTASRRATTPGGPCRRGGRERAFPSQGPPCAGGTRRHVGGGAADLGAVRSRGRRHIRSGRTTLTRRCPVHARSPPAGDRCRGNGLGGVISWWPERRASVRAL